MDKYGAVIGSMGLETRIADEAEIGFLFGF